MAGAAGGSHTPSTTLAEYLLVALILLSLALEAALHRLERWIATRHLHLQAVLRNLYRELMVLGLVSFVFIAYEAGAKPKAETIASFEFAHLFIFLLAIVHTIVVLVSVLTSLSLSRRWRTMEQMDLVKYLELKEQFRRARARRHLHSSALWRRFQWWLPDPRRLFRYWRLHEIMAFHDIRFQFLYYRDLPEDFNFSAYLRKVKAVIFIDLVDAHWSLWLVFLVIVGVDLIRRKYWDNSVFEGTFAITSAVFLTVLAAVLNWKIRRVYWALTKHPAVYFENVSKEAVLNEFAHSPTTSSSNTQSPSRSRSRSITFRPSSSAPSAAVPYGGSDADDEGTDARGDEIVPAAPQTSRDHSDMPHVVMGSSSSPTPSPSSGTPAVSGFDDSVARLSVELPEGAVAGGRITNLVYNESHTDAAVAKWRAGHGRRKQKRVPEPPTPSAGELLQVAERHSLAVRQDNGSRRGSVEMRRESVESGRPSGSYVPGSLMSSPIASVAAGRNGAGNATDSLDPTPPSGVVRVAGRDVRLDMDDAIEPSSSAMDGSPDASRVLASESSGGHDTARFGRRSLDGAREPTLRRPSQDVRGDRHSIDVERPRNTRRSWDEPSGMNGRMSLESMGFGGSRRSQEGARGNRRSIDISSTFPTDELAGRAASTTAPRGNRDVEAGLGNSLASPGVSDVSAGQGAVLADAPVAGTLSSKARGPGEEPRFVNPSLVAHAENATHARTQTRSRQLPPIVLKLIPRLRRVASPVEKLFWFGSHRFFMWLVEFTLFFATVLLSSTGAALALQGLSEDYTSVSWLSIVGISCAFVCLAIVLLRVSYVMKKYVFVLNNAGLVPEVLALQVIHNVHQKRQLVNEMYADAHDDASGAESDEGSEAARERRRKFSKFFSTEAQTSGYIAGESRESNARKSLLRIRGSGNRRLRRRRVRAPSASIPAVPGKTSEQASHDSE